MARSLFGRGLPVPRHGARFVPDPISNPYATYRQHHMLKDFHATPEHFALQSLTPVLDTAMTRHGIPPTAKHTPTYDHPLGNVPVDPESQSSKLDGMEAEMSKLNLAREEGELMTDPNNLPPEEEPLLSQPPCVPISEDPFSLRLPPPLSSPSTGTWSMGGPPLITIFPTVMDSRSSLVRWNTGCQKTSPFDLAFAKDPRTPP